jgi:hypothetical protein
MKTKTKNFIKKIPITRKEAEENSKERRKGRAARKKERSKEMAKMLKLKRSGIIKK